MTGAARWPLLFSSAAHTFSHLLMLLYPTVVLALGSEFPLPYDELVALALPGFVLFGAAALPAGWLGDRWSATGMMAVFFLGTGAAAILTGLATGPWQLAGGLALIGLFASIYHPVGIAWLVHNAATRGRALGINGVFGSVGTAGGAVVAGALTDLLSWRAAFIVPGALCLLTGMAFVVLARRGRLVEPDETSAPHVPASAVDLRRAFAIMAMTVVCVGLIYQTLVVGLPKVFSERVADLAGGSTAVVGLMVSAVFLLGGLAQLIGGELADRYSLRTIYAAGLVGAVPLAALAYGAGDLWLVAAAMAMVGAHSVVLPAENSLLAQFTPTQWRGRIYGIKFVLNLGVSSLGVALVPLVHSLTGSLDGIFAFIVVFATIAAVLALLIPRGRASRASVRMAPAPGE
ncbi:MAG: MFS transporter [Alphaproteobacteria bacterium]|nr:MFS transporter [Alphaproteobacteria bacterium]